MYSACSMSMVCRVTSCYPSTTHTALEKGDDTARVVDVHDKTTGDAKVYIGSSDVFVCPVQYMSSRVTVEVGSATVNARAGGAYSGTVISPPLPIIAHTTPSDISTSFHDFQTILNTCSDEPSV